MSWATHHSESERYASLAQLAAKEGAHEEAERLYCHAAEEETSALAAIERTKTRTLGITAVSAVSLWFKAKNTTNARSMADQWIASNLLPRFALEQINEILQLTWTRSTNQESSTVHRGPDAAESSTALTEGDNPLLGEDEEVDEELNEWELKRKDRIRLRLYSIGCPLITVPFACALIAILLTFFSVPVIKVFPGTWGWGWLFVSFVIVVVFAAAASGLAYKGLLRKRFLARHRLYELSAQLRSGSGFLEIALPSIACFGAAFALAFMKCRGDKACSTAEIFPIYSLITIGSIGFSVWLMHLADYSDISRFLSARQTRHLTGTIGWLSVATVNRLQMTKEHHEIFRPDSSEDDLPDREIDPSILGELLTSLKGRLKKIQEDKNFILLREMYGDVVALFHPDYLPHLAHVYLKISQLRALNMAPRRIQLLGRRWTLKGLESEYVVVHDISELRPEYIEGSSPGKTIGSSKKLGVAESSQSEMSVRETAGNRKESYPQSKWRQRSLKKRAIVTVAPDGTLLSIAIEEERQFNI